MSNQNPECRPAVLTAKLRAVLAAYRRLEQQRPDRTPTASEVAEVLGINAGLAQWHLGRLRKLGELKPVTIATNPPRWRGVAEMEARLSRLRDATHRLGRRLTWDELGELMGA